MFDFLKRPDYSIGNYVTYSKEKVKRSLPDASYALVRLEDQGIEEETLYEVLEVNNRDTKGRAHTIKIQVDGKIVEVNSDFFMVADS